MHKCKIETCEKPAVALGYCYSHYRRNRLYGDPTFVKQAQFHGLPLRERFFKYVQKTPTCWLWTGSKDRKGYGRLTINDKPHLASRISWTLHYGDIPIGKHILHHCDNPQCVNPEHLFMGTPKDNVADMWAKGRGNPGHVYGEKHWASKITMKIADEIRNSELSQNKLAKIYGISSSSVWAIKSGKTWRH